MLEVAQKYLQLKSGEYYKCFGKVDKVVGLTIESIGPKAKLNDLCMIFLDKERRDYVMSEVVGFKDSHIILMPFDNVEGVGVGCIVENTGHPLTVAVGDELLGHTVDGMPKLLERAGRADKGSITGLYTVLVDGDDFNEPITDTARSILDGHIMLDRKLGHKNHYPAIDVLQSISRVMSAIATKEHKNLAGRLKNVLATYTEAEDLINIGAYKNGSNPDIDYAIQKIGAVNSFLCQGTDEKFSFEEELELLEKVFE